LLKIGFFRHLRELKIQRRNPGGALHAIYLCHRNELICGKKEIKKSENGDRFSITCSYQIIISKSPLIQITIPATNAKFKHTNN
jgi:hypothetical protein